MGDSNPSSRGKVSRPERISPEPPSRKSPKKSPRKSQEKGTSPFKDGSKLVDVDSLDAFQQESNFSKLAKRGGPIHQVKSACSGTSALNSDKACWIERVIQRPFAAADRARHGMLDHLTQPVMLEKAARIGLGHQCSPSLVSGV